MASPYKDQEEKDLEKLAKTILSTPHKPREESKLGKGKGPAQPKKIVRPKKNPPKQNKKRTG